MEPSPSLDSRMLNRLRAAVLGANDGIVSTSSVVMGVAGAGATNKAILTAGFAALVAGALSMAVGEYVSVASQKDAEEAHAETHDEEMEFTSPTQAALASVVSFTLGGIIPLLAVLLAPANAKIAATIIAVLVALVVTGYGSATIGKASRKKATARVVVGGLLAMAITYYIGTLFGTVVG